MKKNIPCIVSLIMIVGLSACGPAPAPTLSASDIANTAIVSAWTEVFMTQAANPTATSTLLPPTPTSLPTFTPPPSFTPQTAASVSGSPTPDPCNEPIPPQTQGGKVQVNFINKSGGSVNLAFGMSQKNSLGECGVYSFTLGAFESPTVQVLAGCYWGYGWVGGKEPSTAQTTQYLCLTDSGAIYIITVGAEVIEFK